MRTRETNRNVLIFGLKGYSNNLKTSMTVDKIDSSKGYIKDNIVLCCSIVNKIKQNLSIDELIEWCDLIKYRRVSPLPYMQ